MPPADSEPTIPAGERPQTYALDRAATGIGFYLWYVYVFIWAGDRMPVGVKFSAPVQTGPGAHPATLYSGYRVFPGGKPAGAWRWPPTPM